MPNAMNSTAATMSIHQLMYEKKSVRNATATPKTVKPTQSMRSPLVPWPGSHFIRNGRNTIETAGIRNRYCHATELSRPAANTPMAAESWYPAVNRPKKITLRCVARYLVAMTRYTEPATWPPIVCSMRAMMTTHRPPLMKYEATKPKMEPTNSVSTPNTTMRRSETKSLSDP